MQASSGDRLGVGVKVAEIAEAAAGRGDHTKREVACSYDISRRSGRKRDGLAGEARH